MRSPDLVGRVYEMKTKSEEGYRQRERVEEAERTVAEEGEKREPKYKVDVEPEIRKALEAARKSLGKYKVRVEAEDVEVYRGGE